VGSTSLAVLAMHAYLGSYSRFIADDYCSAAEEHRFGILRAAWFWLRTWNGRYSANVLDAFVGSLGPGFTPAVTAIVLLVWSAALAAAVFMLMPNSSGPNRSPLFSISMAAAILSLALALAPNVAQSLYWGQGMRAIIPPLVVMTLYVAIFAWWRRRTGSAGGRVVWLVASFLMAYGAGGFSETFTALQLAAFVLAGAIWIILGRRTTDRNDILFLSAGLFGALLSFITVVISPGNALRAALSPPPPAIPELLRIALTSYGSFLLNILDSGLKTLALITAFALGLWAGASYDFRLKNWRVAILVLLLGAILTFSCFPPAAYGESEAPPDRTLLIPAFLLVVDLVFLGLSFGNWLTARWKTLPILPNTVIPLLLVAALLSVQQMSRLRPEYAAYAEAWAGFHTQMLGYRQAGIPSVRVRTADLNANNWVGLDVLGDNPKFWLNKCVSDYYGVNVISSSR
jgi:hypothetical protein